MPVCLYANLGPFLSKVGGQKYSTLSGSQHHFTAVTSCTHIEEMGSCLQLTKSKRETSCAKHSDWILNVFEINLDSSPDLLYAREPVCWNFVCLMFSSKGEYRSFFFFTYI